MDKFEKNTMRKERYRLHILAAMILSLVVVNALILFWPQIENSTEGVVFDVRGQEVINIEEIQQTRQEKRKPAPPIPAPPIIMPDDLVLDDMEIEIEDASLIIDDPGTDTEIIEGTNQGANVAARADKGPSPVRIATPQYPREAKRRNIRAEVVIEVLVDERGRVKEARIIKRFLLDKNNAEREPVSLVGYGIEEAALAAARKHIFSPARQNNKRVSSYTILKFQFGV